ncbi:MAG: HAMP domain-containing histidine kinase, partial [Desulfamplus sp.]|nr:HAMP domain-containing histidine kinase [Desulfamplus sp.]
EKGGDKCLNIDRFRLVLMLWARGQRNEINIQPVVIDIGKIIHENMAFFEKLASNKNITLIYDASQSIYAIADYDMILTVVRNLMANAIKFTYPDGKITISCVASDDKIVISVKDSGVGITEEDRCNLFKLNTVSKPGTSKEKGSGLGLVLCKEFVEKNCGEIWVKSELNKGSEFFFSLPKENFPRIQAT